MMRVLSWFGRWFASPLGIYQTVLVLVVWIVGEKIHVFRDPDGYQILYWLTVYSAVTQPILAFIANRGAEDTAKVLGHIERIVEHLDIDAGNS